MKNMIFDLFKRKKNKTIKTNTLSEADKKWNKMWSLWANGEIESPYNELMNYQGEVTNGGHYQYFLNTENNGDVHRELEILCDFLPAVMKNNLQIAFNAYSELEQDKNVDKNEEIIKKCDSVFNDNEKTINGILENFCKTVDL